ncbi:Peroxisomal membrane protein pex14 [Leucoagaricus sp. SymC.cos]|nr:Peroxisomal membrane protein pex14 [Leucoagaricus sp. SymC.cos]
MSSPDRQDLLRNAIAFLQDPKTQASPLTQRIQFLEAKGLTPAEIDQVVRQVSASAPPQGYQQNYISNYTHGPYPLTPRAQGWDWRDYFVIAVISGAVTYGAVSLFKKYLLPHLQPPTSSAYEEDRDALSAQFDAAESLLKEIQSETAAVRAAVEEQKTKIDRTTEDVEAVVSEMRQGESRTRDEMREIREEVNNVREMLPKMIERNKEHHAQSLSELQQEVKSLKALLLNRPTGISSPSPLPPMTRPSIPAWQLGGSAATRTSPPITGSVVEPSAASISPPTYTAIPSVSVSASSSKGKEAEADTGASSS